MGVVKSSAIEFETTPIPANAGGVPTGGTTGQVLAKASNTNNDVTWADAGSGGSGLTQPQVMARSLGC